MSASQYNSFFNQPVYGAVVGEHNTVTINVSQLPPSSPPFPYLSIIGFPPPTDGRTIQQRTSLVEAIYLKLNEPDLNALVLTGIGGVGKSTLAALVYRHAQEYKNAEQVTDTPLWLTIDSSATFVDLVGTIYKALGEQLPSFANLSPTNKAQALFTTLAKSSRLIVLDQFENFLDWNTGTALPDHQEVGAVLDALNSQPFQAGCRLLLTSRSRPKGSQEHQAVYLQEYPVDGLTTTEATELLRKQGVQAPEAELYKAVERCNGHALSLTLLVALWQDYQMPLTGLIDDPAFWGDNIATHLLGAIFTRLNDIQRTLLRAFSVYDIPVPFKVVLSQIEPVEQKQAPLALRTLLTQHLIQPVGEGHYQLHIIVANYFKQHFVEGDAQANKRAVQKAQTTAIEYENRRRMLAKVRTFWINGVLDESLHGAVLIPLRLVERGDIQANPQRITPQREGRALLALPKGTHITEVFDAARGEILILGEPGSGKTTLLLELARDLLSRAEKDESYPIPLILNLSSWTAKRQPLIQWLIEELNAKYQVPRKVGQLWVDTEQLLLLLDGLDEVAPDYRDACIDAINVYRSDHGLVPIVVCSRSAEYQKQTKLLQLQSAVVVQPFTPEQIEEYLTSAGEKLAGVRQAYDEDVELQELATTPLMLSLIALVYSGIPVEKISARGSLATRKQQFLATYVQRMLSIRQAGAHYTQRQSLHWLTWLARQLVKQKQTEFYLERMQLDWLPKNLSYRLYPSFIVGLIHGIGVGLFYGLFFGLYPVPGPRLLLGVGCGALLGLLNWLMFVLLNGVIFEVLGTRAIKKKSEQIGIPSEESRSQKLITTLGIRPVYGLIFGLLNGVLVGWLGTANHIFYETLNGGKNIIHLQNQLLSGIIYGLANLILLTIYFAVLGKLNIKIQPAEIVAWSWKSFRHNLIRSFVFGLLIGLSYGVILGLLYNAWFLQIPIGLGIGLSLGLAFALASGLSHEMVSKQNIMTPNQGIRSSFRNSIVIGLVTALVTGIGIGLAQALGSGLHEGLTLGLIFGLGIGLNFWQRNGGSSCILHALLRVCLWQANYAPLNYPRFLDDMAGRLLLRKVGGGYIFVHHSLLENFATLDARNK